MHNHEPADYHCPMCLITSGRTCTTSPRTYARR